MPKGSKPSENKSSYVCKSDGSSSAKRSKDESFDDSSRNRKRSWRYPLNDITNEAPRDKRSLAEDGSSTSKSQIPGRSSQDPSLDKTITPSEEVISLHAPSNASLDETITPSVVISVDAPSSLSEDETRKEVKKTDEENKFIESSPISSSPPPDFIIHTRLPDNVLTEITNCGRTSMRHSNVCTIQQFKMDKKNFSGEWQHSSNNVTVVTKHHIDSGGMRECYAAKVNNFPQEWDVHASSGWVAKFYKKRHRFEESWHFCRRDVQTQALAQRLSKNFRHLIKQHRESFGDFPRINPAFLVQYIGLPSCFTIEPLIKPNKPYEKFVNNDGEPTKAGLEETLGQKCLAFSHWVLTHTDGRFLLCDLQGTQDVLTDIQVACRDQSLFGKGNLGERVFQTFANSHVCNKYCRILKLKEIVPDESRREETK